MRWKHIVVIMSVLVVATGCGADSTPEPSVVLTVETPNVPTFEPTTVADAGNADSEGKILFETFREEVGFSCVTCHYIHSDNRLLGPGLLSIEARFATYDTDVPDLETYIRESILMPEVFITPADPPFPENIMPRTYADVFTDEEIDALVEYILSA